MQQLHLVGFTADNRGLIFSARKGSKSGGFVVTLDDKLIARVDEMIARRAAEEQDERASSRPKSNLSPREIQARLRAGRTIAQVAREAGVEEEWVARWAAPILAEQAQVVERAEGLTMEKSRVGPSTVPLGEAVRWNMADKGIVFTGAGWSGSWDAFHLRDNTWMVRFTYQYRRKTQQAEWEVDTRDAIIVSRNRQATELGYVAPGRRRPKMPRSMLAALESAAAPEPRSAAGSAASSTSKTSGRKRPATRKAAASKTAARKAAAKEAAAKKLAAKKAAAKKLAAKKAAAKKAAAKKSAAKKSAAKKAAAKKAAARKSVGRKAASKKSPAKKSLGRSAAKKASPKREGAKKAAPRKSPGRKASGRKSAARKQTPKKASPRKAASRPPARMSPRAPVSTARPRPRPAASSTPPPVRPSASSRSNPVRPPRPTTRPSAARSAQPSPSRPSRRAGSAVRRPEPRRPEPRRPEPRRPEAPVESDGAAAGTARPRGRQPARQVEGFPRPATKGPIRIDSGVPRRPESSGPPIIHADRADQRRDEPVAVGGRSPQAAPSKQGRFRFRRGRNRT